MPTIRGRLAVWYAVAMTATMFVFAGVIYLVQRGQSFAQLDSRLRIESDLLAAMLGESYRARDSVIVRDPQDGRIILRPDVAALLEGVPGIVMVLGGEWAVVFLSPEARALPFAASQILLDATGRADPAGGFGLVDLGPPAGQVRYDVRRVTEAGGQVTAVVSAVSTAGTELGPQRLLTAMLVVAPFILVASTAIGYHLVGRTLEPVDSIVDEVEAITDGRSLHRRLAPSPTHDELARLTTTLNEMLGRLERSFLALRRFTADASHELKTPLTVLRSGIERSLTYPGAPADVLEILEETLSEVNRMTELVDALLMLARADEGRAPLHVETLDFREILEEVAETASILGEQGAVQVAVEVPARPLPLEADRSRVRQLLLNLVTNAVKYTPAGGSVGIGSVVRDAVVVVTVRDTGIGIAPGDLPHVFDRFWRADPARSRTGQRPGAGLGLAICKWIAEAHGGSIALESRPGRGTTVTVTLPIGHPAPSPN